MMTNNSWNTNAKGKGQNNNYNRGYYNEVPHVKEAKLLPVDYVEEAELVIRRIAATPKNQQITTTKIRKLLGLVMDIYNKEQIRAENTLLPKSVSALQMLQIRVIYEAGREQMTKTFVEEAKLIEYLKGIDKSRDKLMSFSHYMEALVAYHRFYDLGKKE